MPTYDYECQACGHAFELFQSMTAKVKRKCPKCGKLGLQRLIGPGAGFLFKGQGFYITDYRSDSYKSAEKKATGDGAGGSTTGSDGKSESKKPKPDSGGKAKTKAGGKTGT